LVFIVASNSSVVMSRIEGFDCCRPALQTGVRIATFGMSRQPVASASLARSPVD
jgi:hypothetical protein